MPLMLVVASLYALFTLTTPRCNSGLTTATIDDSDSSARASSSVRYTSRPARSPPACRLVRPPQTMPMFFPSSRSVFSLPCWNPSPMAERMTTDTIPHRIPNIVRKLRSLFARRFCSDWTNASFMNRRARVQPLGGQHQLVAGLQPAEYFDLRPVADADCDWPASAAALLSRLDDVHKCGLFRVVRHGRFWNEQRLRMLLQHDLGVRRHVGLELLARIVDRHLHLEAGDVVFLDAER